jgi:hypothetical protein
MINVSLLRIFLKTGLTGFPTKKSGPDPIEHCRTTPITNFQPRERPETARRWMLLERGVNGPGLNFNTLLATNEAKGHRSADFYALNIAMNFCRDSNA